MSVPATDHHLPAGLEQPVRRYVESIQEIFGGAVLGLTAYGPTVVGDYDLSMDFLRTVLVVDHVDLNKLRRLAQRGTQLGRDYIAAPLIMTPAYIEASRDTFPLELMEIAGSRHTVLGRDYFDQMPFEERHVRLQCERELKSVLVRLRQGLLLSGGREDFLSDLEMEVSDSLGRTLRGMLWLHERRDYLPPLRMLDEVEQMTGGRYAGMRGALILEADHGWEEFTTLYRDVAALMEFVDAW